MITGSPAGPRLQDTTGGARGCQQGHGAGWTEDGGRGVGRSGAKSVTVTIQRCACMGGGDLDVPRSALVLIVQLTPSHGRVPSPSVPILHLLQFLYCTAEVIQGSISWRNFSPTPLGCHRPRILHGIKRWRRHDVLRWMHLRCVEGKDRWLPRSLLPILVTAIRTIGITSSLVRSGRIRARSRVVTLL